jgi:hypothetical protein
MPEPNVDDPMDNLVALLLGATASPLTYLLGAAAVLRSSWCSGLIEKNL